jgi:PqqD family protein of HPr-rel-A system
MTASGVATTTAHRQRPAGDRWRVPPGPAPIVRRWPEEFAVFNPLSGHTHFLDPVAGGLVDLLSRSEQSTETLRTRVAEWLELDADAALAANVDAMLARLADEGLVEPVP